MQTENLRKNIFDEIEEGQLKLGYREEEIRLYYPRASLCALLGVEMSAEALHDALAAFAEETREELGGILISNRKDRFCLTIPAAGVRYIHEHTDGSGFLAEFIALMRRHGTAIDEVRALFDRYSDCVRMERCAHGEFDWLLYFENGEPSDYYYCLSDEGCHMIYHRFTKADYEAMGL